MITARTVITPRTHTGTGTHHASKTSVVLCAAERGGDIIGRRRERVCDAAARRSEVGNHPPNAASYRREPRRPPTTRHPIRLRCGAGGSAHSRSLRPAIIYKDNESGVCEYLRRHRRRGYTLPKYTRPRFSVESSEPYWSEV